MKKNILLKLITILFCCFLMGSIEVVQADSCSTKELNTLKQLAHNIKITYDLYDDTYNENHIYYFNIFATNFSKEFYLIDSDGQDFRYMSNLEKDGIRKLRAVKEGSNYVLTVYTSNETKCPNTKIVTKKVELPYYNDYSQREECEGIEDFSLCQRYYSGYIESEKYFLDQVNKYKNGELEEKPNDENKGIISQLINFASNHLLIVIAIAIVLVAIIVFVIIKIIKSRKRTKIRI